MIEDEREGERNLTSYINSLVYFIIKEIYTKQMLIILIFSSYCCMREYQRLQYNLRTIELPNLQ